jgi:hypothetical protein
MPIDVVIRPYDWYYRGGIYQELVQATRNGHCRCTDECGVTDLIEGATEWQDPFWRDTEETWYETNIW